MRIFLNPQFVKKFCCTVLLCVYAPFSSKAQQIINLAHHSEKEYIGKYFSWFEDKDRTYSISDVSSDDKLFLPYHDDILSFGFTSSVYWLKLAVTGNDPSEPWIIEIRYPVFDSITLYYKDEAGNWKEKTDGDNIPMHNREVNSRTIAFRLSPAKSGITQYYFKLRTTGSVTFPAKIEREEFFSSESVKAELFYGVCYGIMIVMLFYNVFIYFSTKDKSYIYYVLQVTFALLTYGLFYGHFTQYILHERNPDLNYIVLITGSLWNMSIIQFIKTFLNISRISKAIITVLNITLVLYILNLVLMFVTGPALASQVYFIIAILLGIMGLLAGFVSWRRGNHEARFFVLAWTFHLFAILTTALRGLALLPAYEFIMNILIIGNVVEITLLSFALADKINIYRKQKELDQAQIIHLKEEDAMILEQKVKERTSQLLLANEEIRLRNQDLETFSHSASHDLRAPLRAITGFAGIIERKASELDEMSRQALNTIQASARNMERLIEDLLAFSRLGKKELRKEKVNMNELVGKSILDLKQAQQEESGLSLTVNTLPDAYADPALLKQVWINLLSNAIKFSSKKPDQKVEVGAFAANGEIHYYVKDNGAGFNMKETGNLFEPFHRLHGQSEFEGTGLGLSIVKKIVMGHGGRVWAEAKEGQGAIFYFSLPAEKN